jgi:hypothetical protein
MLPSRVACLIALFFLGSVARAAEPVLVVEGRTSTITAQALADLPRVRATVDDHGTPARFEGVSLHALLIREGAPAGKELRGATLDRIVVVSARDGYRGVFALAELDPALGRREVLLVDRRDDKPLGDGEGPWRLVVPGDGRAARWVRQVERIEVRAAP